MQVQRVCHRLNSWVSCLIWTVSLCQAAGTGRHGVKKVNYKLNIQKYILVQSLLSSYQTTW